MFAKLVRRYKYLQRSLEDTLRHVLQFINKWQATKVNKLAMATGYFITTQLTSLSVLKILLKDYLVKDGTLWRCVILFFIVDNEIFSQEHPLDLLRQSLGPYWANKRSSSLVECLSMLAWTKNL